MYKYWLFTLCCLSFSSEAKVYQCIADNGKVKFQQTPCSETEVSEFYQQNKVISLASITQVDVFQSDTHKPVKRIVQQADLETFAKLFGLKQIQPHAYVPNRKSWQNNVIYIDIYTDKVERWIYRTADGYLFKAGRYPAQHKYFIVNNTVQFERLLK